MALFPIRGQNKRNPFGQGNFKSTPAYPVLVPDNIAISLDTPLYGRTGYIAYSGHLNTPLSTNSVEATTRCWFDNPVLGRRPLLQDWNQSVVGDDSVEAATRNFTLLAPSGKDNRNYSGWQASPLSSDTDLKLGQQVFDLPVIKKVTPVAITIVSPLPTNEDTTVITKWFDNPSIRNKFTPKWESVPIHDIVVVDNVGTNKFNFDNPLRKQPPLPKSFAGWMGEEGVPVTATAFDTIAVFLDTPLYKEGKVFLGVFGWFNSPLSSDKVTATPLANPWFDLPVKGRKPLLDYWLQSPLSKDSIEADNKFVFDLPPTGKYPTKHNFEGWNQKVLADNIYPPIGVDIQWFDTPIQVYKSKHGYGFFTHPLSEDNIIIPPAPEKHNVGGIPTKKFNKPAPLQYDQAYLERIFGKNDEKLKRDLYAAAGTELRNNSIAFDEALYEIKLALRTAIELAQNDNAILDLAIREKQIIDSIVVQKQVQLRTKHKSEEDILLGIITNLL